MHYVSLPKAFFVWLITGLPKTLLHIFINTNLLIENALAIRLHAKLLFVPLFHDTTIAGRFISVFFRLARVLGGTIALCAVNMLLAPLLAAILLIPLYPLLWRPALILWPLLFMAYAVFIFNKPRKRVTATLSANNIQDACTAETRKLLRLLKNSQAFFAACADEHELQLFFLRAGYNHELLHQFSQVPSSPAIATQTIYEPLLKIAQACKARYIEPIHLVAALAVTPGSYGQFFASQNVDAQLLLATAKWMTHLQNEARQQQVWDDDYYDLALGGVNRGWEGVPTPTLNNVSVDITAQAAAHQLPPVVGRDETMKQLFQILSRAEHDNVLLVGEPGVGKSAIVSKLAQKIVEGEVPKSLFSKRLVRLDASALVAGVAGQGGLEARMNTIIKEITASDNIVLYISDIHALSAISSAQGNINLYDLLKPHLSSTRFQVIGTTTIENYERYLEPNGDFMRLFQVVQVTEVSEQESIEILQYIAPAIEQRHGVLFSLPALIASVKLSSRYVHDRTLPGKAKDLLDEAAVVVSQLQPNGVVVPHVIESLVEQKTHIPVHNASSREKDVLLHLEAKIHARFIDQEEAVTAVANAMRRARTQLTDKERPIASFLFVGPTGVGKTELAKTLSEVYFGSEDAYIRFDMSEFQEPMSVYRLIGSPASSNENQPGQLTEAVRQKPFSLLLFDEIEKANPKILDLFLQILEDGRLTDSSGHTVTFKDTIIIATSNAATMQIEQLLASGMTAGQVQQNITQVLSQSFRIEYLNRFDDIIVFKPLSMNDMTVITQKMLAGVSRNLSQKGFHVTFGQDVIVWLAQKGYDPQLGARPLRRLIENQVESTIAKLMLSDQLPKGQQVTLTMQHFSSQS